jgi:hypothetical protein
MMGKKLFFLFFFILSSINIAGQIQRKFFDFTLGVTTRQQVTNYWKARQKKIWYPEEECFSVRHISFGGNTWPVAYFHFYKNKLYLVYFSDSEGFTLRETLDVVWKRLDKSLMSKYGRFYIEETSSSVEKEFEDNKTRLNFKYDYFQGRKGLSLMYTDIRLYGEMLDSEDSEL